MPDRVVALAPGLCCVLACAGLLWHPSAVPGAAPPAEPTTRPGYVPLLTVGEDAIPWSARLVPAAAPRRQGRAVTALRWPVDTCPCPDSPALLRGFGQVRAVRFWLHVDKPHPFTLSVLLTGGKGGYYHTRVALDFAGWKRITLPIGRFRPAYEPALKNCTRLSFRMQGYGQPKLPAGMTWWVGDIEAQPKPGAKLVLLNGSEDHRPAWRALAPSH